MYRIFIFYKVDDPEFGLLSLKQRAFCVGSMNVYTMYCSLCYM